MARRRPTNAILLMEEILRHAAYQIPSDWDPKWCKMFLALAQVLLHAGLHAVPVNAKGKLEEEGSEPYLQVGLGFGVLDRVGCREKALNRMIFEGQLSKSGLYLMVVCSKGVQGYCDATCMF